MISDISNTNSLILLHLIYTELYKFLSVIDKEDAEEVLNLCRPNQLYGDRETAKVKGIAYPLSMMLLDSGVVDSCQPGVDVRYILEAYIFNEGDRRPKYYHNLARCVGVGC